MLVIFLATFLIQRVPYSDKATVRVVWPERVSTSAPSQLMAHVYKYHRNGQPKDVNANVSVYLLTQEGNHRYMSNRRFAQIVVDKDSRLKEIIKGKSDKSGLIKLKLPPIKLIKTKKRATYHYILKVDVDGEIQYISKKIDPTTEAALVALTLDRPLYQPGQEVKARALFLDSDENKAVSGDVTWRVKDPQNNLIFEEKSTISASGITHTTCALAAEGIQGTYTLEVEHLGQKHTKRFDVQPFKLPKFKVEVVPLTKLAVAGKPIKAQVIVTYTHGERVKGAKTAVRIRTRRNGASQYNALEGKTDNRGVYEFNWTVPEDIESGGQMSIEANATTETGHAQEGKASIAVAGERFQLNVMSLEGSSFYWNQPGKGVFILKDGRNQPVANAKVAIYLPQAKTEREVLKTSDPQGRVTFDWTPSTKAQRTRVSVEVTMPSGRKIRRHINLPVRYGKNVFRTPELITTVGKPFRFEVSTQSVAGMVLAFRRGLPIASVNIPAGAGFKEVSMTFDASARGLVYLVALDHRANFIGSTPIVVEQRGSSQVSIKTDKVLYKPGTQAKVTLGFDAYVDDVRPKTDKPPVTFGLVGVDEALYTLKERTDMSLRAIMRKDPAVVSTLQSTLNQVDSKDTLSKQIAIAKFKQAIGGNYNPMDRSYRNQRNFSHQVRKLKAKTRKIVWAILLGLALLSLCIYAGVLTVRNLSKRAFSWKRLGLFIGCTILFIPVLIVLAAMGQEKSMMGGMFVWGLVLGGWLVSAAWHQPELFFSRWLWIVVVLGGLGACLVAALNGVNPRGALSAFLVICGGGSLLLMGLQLLVWPFILVEHGERKAGYALATLFVLPLGGLLLSVGGRAYKADFAPQMEGGRFAKVTNTAAPPRSFAEEEDAPSPKQTKARPGKPLADGVPKKDQPRVRSYFPETMVWLPEVHSDASGQATTNIEVPDSITTWRLNAWANTWDGRLGEGQAPMKVWQDFFVEVNVPMILTQSDVVDIPVTLVNHREQATQVTLTAKTKGDQTLNILSNTNQTIDVAAGERKTLYLRLAALKPGTGALTVYAKTPGPSKGDAVEHRVKVMPNGRTLRMSSSSIIQDGMAEPLVLPSDTINGSFYAQVKLFPSPIADALDGLDGMVRRPTGCFEQTSSANYPNVIVSQALKRITPDKWPSGPKGHAKLTKRTRRMLHLGYQRMLGFQKSSGGFALYPTTKKPDIMLTAYGVLQLSQMRKVHKIDDNVIKRALTFLVRNQNSNGTWPVYASRLSGGGYDSQGDVGQVRSTAFVALAILESPFAEQYKDNIKRALDHIARRYESVSSPNALAIAANALLAGKRTDALNKVLNVLAASVQHKEGMSYWSSNGATWIGGRNHYANVETTAIAAYVFNKTAAKRIQLGKVLQYIAKRRHYYGGWGTTQATVWALRTLVSLAANAQEKVTLDLTMDGQPIKTANGRGEPGIANIDRGSVLVQHFATEALGNGTHQLNIKPRQGKSIAVAQLTSRYAVPWTSPRAKVQGEHFAIKLKRKSSATFGQKMTHTVEIYNQRPLNLGATIVELPLPPGGYAPSAQFEDLKKNNKIDHYEVLPTHVRLYLSGMPRSGKQTFVYHFVPLLRGKVTLPAVRAYVFYTPDPTTEVNGGALSID